MTERFDILISGASYSGAALALALEKSLGGPPQPALRIGVLDKSTPAAGNQQAESPRAFAIAAASRNLLEYIGIWPQIAEKSQPVAQIEISDSPLDAGIRPVLLTYENTIDDCAPGSHIVPDAVLANALHTALENSSVALVQGVEALELRENNSGATLQCSDGIERTADLIVAAEGRQSRLRDQAGIKSIGWDYNQSGICTVISHTKPHHGRAAQHFLPGGPFAMLPLPGNKTCITWSEKSGEARRIMALDDQSFLAEVEKRVAGRLGDLSIVTRPASWPLNLRMSRSLVAGRLALLGDTARGVHPIAGQGLNLGMRDVAALTEIIVENARIGLPPSDPDGLQRYERWRRFDSAMSAAAFDGLNRLFSNDNTLLRSIREAGLGLVDRLPFAKTLFVNEAAGLSGEVPRLLRGEAL